MFFCILLNLKQEMERISKEKIPKETRLYRYELGSNNKLTNPTMLLDLPATPCCYHNGGKITIGPDGNVYLMIGDLQGHPNKVKNFKNGTDPDGRSAIYRITRDGNAVPIPSLMVMNR